MAGALLLALAVAALAHAPAQAQIRRCTAADGSAVFTDRDCAALGAVESRPQAEGPATARRGWRGGCARSLQALVFEVGMAIDARDGNRLARSYHWTGMGHRAGYSVIERLDAIAQRPLLDLTAVYPQPSAPMPVPTDAAPPATGTGAAATAAPGTLPAPAIANTAAANAPVAVARAMPAAPQRPIGLRLDQVLADGITPSTTTFGLRRHMDCWWLSL